MKLARAVQQHLYTMPPLEVDGFDIAGTAFPADATGGDYFDIVPLPKRCIGISIGDVCGHGLASAMLMAELRAYARAFARRSLRVGEILTLLNSALISDLGEESYATFAFCRLHPGTRTFTYASAGHVPGYLLDAGGGVKQVLGSTDIPLGLLEDRVFSGSEEIGLQPGEILALLTDGITEAERPDQAQFGAARAIEFIREHRQESAAHIVGGLFRAVREFAGGLPQRDDITAVICKSQATPKPGRRARARSAA
jgi:sigma-B regulation protein RsbU (phosphoserine phosphatase)